MIEFVDFSYLNVEDNGITTETYNKETKKLVCTTSEFRIPEEVQNEIDQVFREARLNKQNSTISRIKKRLIEAFNLDL